MTKPAVDIKGYIEVSHKTWLDIEVILNSKPLPLDSPTRRKVTEKLHGYRHSKEKPTWIVGDIDIPGIFWEGYAIIKGQG